jgi:hypothetical protein
MAIEELVIYQTGGSGAISVRLEHDSVWLSRRQMAELFDTSTDNISLHLKNIYANGELIETATTEDSSVVQQEAALKFFRSSATSQLAKGDHP